MQSIAYLRGSAGTANSSVATVQNVRAPGATTILVNTVSGIPPKFYASMGTPHTFTDPVTGEIITVVSEASAVDFAGSVSGGNLNIDAIAPGYTDAGSKVGDIVVIRPNTEWANNLANTLVAEHNDDGTHPVSLRRLTGEMVPYAGRTAPSGWLLCDGSAVSRSTYSSLFSLIASLVGTFTTTIAAPGVLTLNSHGLQTGDQIYLTTTGALPTGLTANTLYYVVKIDANTFNLATSRANAYAATKITTSGTQSGTHSLFSCPYGLGDGSTTFNVPDARGRVIAGNDFMGGTAASRLTLALSQGAYGNMGANGGEEGHTLTSPGEIPSHTHLNKASQAGFASGGVSITYLVNTGSGNFGGNDVTGSGGAHNNVQPTLVANHIIKT
jgi:microcystin-dependent protein